MHKERFWVGVAVCVVPLALALTALGSSGANGRNNPVEGHVSIRGRPLTGGYIVFVPDDQNLGEASGRIDQNGHYAIRSSWWRGGREAFPDLHHPPTPSGTGQGPSPGSDWDRLVASGADARRPGAKNVALASLRRLSDPGTSNLAVHLDAEPAHIDIAL